MHWLDCLSWSLSFLVDHLWDSKTFFGFLLIWAGTALQKWWKSGWRLAGMDMAMTIATTLQALQWSAYIVLAFFILLTGLVAPVQKYNDLNDRYAAERKANDELKKAFISKEEELQLAWSKSRESEKAIVELQDTVMELQRKSDSVEVFKKFTESTRMMPYIEILPPLFQRVDNEKSLLVFRYKNTGYSEATLTRSRFLMMLGGVDKENTNVGTMPMLMIPQQQFSFTVPITNLERKAVDDGVTTLDVVIEMKYDDKFGGKHVLCVRAPYLNDSKKFSANITDKQCP